VKDPERLRERTFKWSLIVAGGFMGACIVGFWIASGDVIEGLLMASLWGGSTLLILCGLLAVFLAVTRIASRRRL
jgi:hypothetical protein